MAPSQLHLNIFGFKPSSTERNIFESDLPTSQAKPSFVPLYSTSRKLIRQRLSNELRYPVYSRKESFATSYLHLLPIEDFHNLFPHWQSECWIQEDDIKLEAVINTGEFGHVYLCKYGGRFCAAKEVAQGRVTGLYSEGCKLRDISMQHGICDLYGFWRDSTSRIFIIMEYMRDGSIQKYLQRHIMDPYTKLQICSQILNAVQYLFTKGILHCDIASRNILIDVGLAGEPVRAVLSGFGLSRMVDQNEPSEVLSPRWSSPELLESKIPTYSSELWSTGVTMWEIMTNGKMPYQDLSNEEVCEGLKQGSLWPDCDQNVGLYPILIHIFN